MDTYIHTLRESAPFFWSDILPILPPDWVPTRRRFDNVSARIQARASWFRPATAVLRLGCQSLPCPACQPLSGLDWRGWKTSTMGAWFPRGGFCLSGLAPHALTAPSRCDAAPRPPSLSICGHPERGEPSTSKRGELPRGCALGTSRSLLATCWLCPMVPGCQPASPFKPASTNRGEQGGACFSDPETPCFLIPRAPKDNLLRAGAVVGSLANPWYVDLCVDRIHCGGVAGSVGTHLDSGSTPTFTVLLHQ